MDVGQGDGAILISPQGETVLFDNGTSGECDKPLSYLLQLGVMKLDYHIASHYHSDHIGCTTDIVPRFPLVHDALDRGGQYSTTVYSRYVAAVGSRRKTAVTGRKIQLDAATARPVEIEIVALNGDGVPTTNENDLSVSAVIRYGSFHAEIGGDLSGFNTGDYRDIETGVSGRVGRVEVYKVHHHGSKYSSNTAWLAWTRPLVGVISIGSGNTYGHPTAECLGRLHAAGVKTYWTEYGAGAAPSAGQDVVAGNVVVEVEPGSDRFSVRHGATTDWYTSWEVTPSVVSAATFQAGVSPSSWAAVYGRDFTQTSRGWRTEEIVDGKLPVALDGVQVRINGQSAAISYISPAQINVQIPDIDATGLVPVEVITTQGAVKSAIEMRRSSPGLFMMDVTHVVAQHLDFSYVTQSTPVRPLEYAVLWGTGFGPSAPPIAAGWIVTQPAALANKVTVWIGGAEAEVLWAGISGAGLWQINVRVPAGLPVGDARIVAEVGGVRTQENAFIAVGR